jgi:hypothetical protein
LKAVIRVGLVAVLCILFASLSWGANIVVNSGFETGDFSGWIMQGVQDLSGPPPQQGAYNNVVSTPPFPLFGDFGADLGDGGDTVDGEQVYATLTQFWTNLDPTATYALTYYLSSVNNLGNNPDGDDPTNEFQVWWNDGMISSQQNIPFGFPTAGFPTLFGGLSSNGTNGKLQFKFFNAIDDFGLDQVCIDNVPGDLCGAGDNGEIPEPSTLALISLPLIGLALARRRK